MGKSASKSQGSITFVSIGSLIIAILFYSFFMATKKSASLNAVAPFVDDPYDLVGSFAIQIALAVGFLNVVRIYLMKSFKIAGRLKYVGRGCQIVAWAILATMLADVIAILLKLPQSPIPSAQIAMFIWMAILILVSIVVWMKSANDIKGLMSSGQARDVQNELEFIFKDALAPVNPRFHPILFSIIIAVICGVSISIGHLIGEGAAATYMQTVLALLLFAAIETTAVFIGTLVIGRYLGILGPILRHKKETA